jgi:acetyl esterase/lipase
MRCSAASFETKAGVDPLLTRRSLSAMADAYLSGADRKAPLASPNLADLHGLPPLLIQTGSDEVLLDDAVGLDAAAKRQGVETTLEIWPGMIHVWHMFHPLLPEAGQAVAGIVRHLRKNW